jgi:hypothetical protein
MKKVLKIFIKIIIIILILFFINFIRNLIIINKIKNTGSELLDSSNYSIEIRFTDSNNSVDTLSKIYRKDAVTRIDLYNSGEYMGSCYKNYPTGEYISTDYTGKYIEDNTGDAIVTYNNFVKDGFLINSMHSKQMALSQIIKIEDNNYVITDQKNVKYYYNKKTNDLEKVEFVMNDNELLTTYTFSIERNVVTDENVEKP